LNSVRWAAGIGIFAQEVAPEERHVIENDLGRYPGLLPILAIDFDLKSACVNALGWDTTGSNTPATAVRVVEQAGSRWVGR
jgi:hypothetical protein